MIEDGYGNESERHHHVKGGDRLMDANARIVSSAYVVSRQKWGHSDDVQTKNSTWNVHERSRPVVIVCDVSPPYYFRDPQTQKILPLKWRSSSNILRSRYSNSGTIVVLLK